MSPAAPRHSPVDLAAALGLQRPTEEQAAVISAPPGPVVVIAGAGAGKTETMAARVVWLVANGYADPGQVLGLTFTRKAAGQLLRRVRARLTRLAGVGLTTGDTGVRPSAQSPTVSTYDAFAGGLLREHGALLGVERAVRLLSPTACWQLFFDVVNGYPAPVRTSRGPDAVTDIVVRLAGRLAEHLADTTALAITHHELERLVHTLPPGPRQRDQPSADLLRKLEIQQERAEFVPLIDAVHRRFRAEGAMDFGSQMAAAARLAVEFGQVGAELREMYRVVLLDEYQDTGHAQRTMLAALFGGGIDDGLALTAVGDPIQSIYGWRGASATNLPRFATDFPHGDGTPATTLELRTSWRNPPEVLRVANWVSEAARRRSVEVHTLQPRPQAPPGTVRVALLPDVAAEREWIADHLQRRHRAAVSAGTAPPTAAVLVRRNADAGPMAEAIRAHGVPVEVVGLAGLLSVPQVADLVAMLRLAADPTAGVAALRVLAGPRWRLGTADIAALWNRATQLGAIGSADGQADTVRADTPETIAAGSAAPSVCLADALADPGAPQRYSAPGYARIRALAAELTALRGYLWHPLPQIVAETRRVLGLDWEARAAAESGRGVEHLDAFADIVADYAEHAPGIADPVGGLLAYLDVAADAEHGLAVPPPAPVAGRVQVLTVHSAKGLEWQVVAVAHLVERVFPSTAAKSTWLNDPGELPPLLRGDRASANDSGDGPRSTGVPVLDTDSITHRQQLEEAIEEHRRQLDRRNADEERRLLYVAVTRAEDTLLASGHHWAPGRTKPVGPSEFLTEIRDAVQAGDGPHGAGEDPCGPVGTFGPGGRIEHWAPSPPDGAANPLHDAAVEALWPPDPLGTRRLEITAGAALVTQRMREDEPGPGPSVQDPAGGSDGPAGRWTADAEALLAERAEAMRAAGNAPEPEIPTQLSVSALVELTGDRAAAMQRLNRRLPARPDSEALLGTAFHEWVQRHYGTEQLFDLADLPGSADPDAATADAAELDRLKAAFGASQWAKRTPVEVEVPFEMAVGPTVVRGRIDAVFADGDGGFTVVDWKTGSPPVGAAQRRRAAVQLAVYRLAWAALADCDAESVQVVFHYVREGRTVVPDTLPDLAELTAVLGG